MYRLQYRNFGSHESLVGNMTTNTGVGNGAQDAGVRWFELRRLATQRGNGWSLHQEGTLGGPGQSRWIASAAMDQDGNLAMGYSRSNSSIHPESLLAGRSMNDALGTLSIADQLVADGTGVHVNSRFGDYASLSVDPVDGCTFWWTGEYIEEGTIWKTLIT